MQHIIQQLEEKRARARQGGGEKRAQAQHAKGKLTARERIQMLFDLVALLVQSLILHYIM